MQTIGERLEEARKKKGISIREAAEATKIRGDYLQKFESNHFDIGLTEIYTRGFLRTYSNFLKLPADRILNDYAALGRGEVRPRQPSREVYGRMDISVAGTGEAGDRAEPPDGSSSEDSGSGSRQSSGRSRSATSLPSGPDPAVVFRYLKMGGIGFAAILVVLIIIKLWPEKTPETNRSTQTTPSGSATTGGTPATMQPLPGERTITLTGVDVVQVRVVRAIDKFTEGTEIYSGLLRKGQKQPVTFTGPIFIWFSSGENLELEFQGHRWNRGNNENFRGTNKLYLPE